MSTLYELVKEIEDFEFIIDDETGEILNADELDNLQMERQTKIEQLCLWRKNLLSDADAYKNEKESFAKKEKAARNKAESLKEYIEYTLGGEKFKTDRVTVSYRRSEVVECSNIFDVDDDYLTYKDPVLNKTKIKEAIKSGINVKGAHLVERNNIQIR